MANKYNSLVYVGSALGIVFLFRKQIGEFFSGFSKTSNAIGDTFTGVGTGVSDAVGGVGKGISQVATSGASAFDVVTTEAAETVSAGTDLIQEILTTGRQGINRLANDATDFLNRLQKKPQDKILNSKNKSAARVIARAQTAVGNTAADRILQKQWSTLYPQANTVRTSFATTQQITQPNNTKLTTPEVLKTIQSLSATQAKKQLTQQTKRSLDKKLLLTKRAGGGYRITGARNITLYPR